MQAVIKCLSLIKLFKITASCDAGKHRISSRSPILISSKLITKWKVMILLITQTSKSPHVIRKLLSAARKYKRYLRTINIFSDQSSCHKYYRFFHFLYQIHCSTASELVQTNVQLLKRYLIWDKEYRRETLLRILADYPHILSVIL